MNFERAIDISRPIRTGSVVYPGDPPLGMSSLCEIGEDSPCSITRLDWITHFLTHIDPPRHFLPRGQTVDRLPLGVLCGEALVVEVDGPVVRPDDIPSTIPGRILFKTKNSERWDPERFIEDHVYVSPEAARLCVDRGAKLVGIDYLSPDAFGDESYPVHNLLLAAGIPILEGIDLSQVAPGTYTLIALPLKIQAGDGSPVRAILIP